MDSQLTSYITIVCVSGMLNVFLCGYVFYKRSKLADSSLFFIPYTAALAIYCLAYAFGLTSTTLAQVKFWNSVQYVGMPFAPVLGLMFVMQYLGFPVTRKRVILLLIIPLISLFMVITNDLHHLHYKIFEIYEDLGAPFVRIEIGIWYVINGLFTFGSLFTALLLLLSRMKESAKRYRPQLFILIIGQFVPIVSSFLYLVGVTPPGIDPVPMIIWVTSGLYLWAVVSSRLLTIIPIAKDTIFNSISDGVIVLDASNRLIECNQACKNMLPKLDNALFGQHVDQVWLAISGKKFPFNLESDASPQELILAGRFYEVRLSQLQISSKYRAGTLVILVDITELKQLQLKLEYLAYYDDLTRIYNRRAFFKYCEEWFVKYKQQSKPFSIILFDIDYFKKVNDHYGHHVGDQLIQHVVQVCQRSMNEEVLFARYGGEEFVLALPMRTAEDAEILATLVRENLERSPLIIDDVTIYVTSSFGIAQASGQPEETLLHLLRKADEALYSVKRNGRNQVGIYRGEA